MNISWRCWTRARDSALSDVGRQTSGTVGQRQQNAQRHVAPSPPRSHRQSTDTGTPARKEIFNSSTSYYRVVHACTITATTGRTDSIKAKSIISAAP